MRRSLMKALCLLAVLSSSCASKLEKDKVDRVERGEGQAIDISQLRFTELESGASIDLKTLMERDGKEYLLMMFGSMSCASCNKKNEFLRDEVVGKHQLFVNERGRAFELVGVNTDVDRLRPSVQLFKTEKKFDFIRLADPRGEVMVSKLLPEGEAFGVPFTVLMTKRGIAWRYTNKDHVEIEEVMNRVAVDMGLDRADPAPPGKHDDEPKPLPVLSGRLHLTVADRLSGVALSSCGGADVGSLEGKFKDPDVRYVVAARNTCGAECQSTLKEIRLACGSGVVSGRTCEVQGIAGETGAESECLGLGLSKGGREFFDVFPSFFDWSHPRELAPNQIDVTIKPMADLVVMGFDRAGQVVYAHEGSVDQASLTNRMATADFGSPERGPDFGFYGINGELKFADMRKPALFTVVNFFDINCTECVQDMGAWSKPGKLFDFCAASGGKCQALAFEDQEDYMERPIADYFKEIVEGDPSTGAKGLKDFGVRLSLVMDPLRSDPSDAKTRLPRLYDGYFKGLYGKTSYVGGAMVWDREGKLVDFVGAPFGEHVDIVQQRLEKLIEMYDGQKQSAAF